MYIQANPLRAEYRESTPQTDREYYETGREQACLLNVSPKEATWAKEHGMDKSGHNIHTHKKPNHVQYVYHPEGTGPLKKLVRQSCTE